MDAQQDKTGTESLVYHAQLDKTGMQPQDHADAQSVQTGTELHVSVVSEEDNGALKPNNVSAHQETGTDSHVFHVPQDNNGTQLITHVHAQLTLSGTVLTAELAQEITDIGTIKSTIVLVELDPAAGPSHVGHFFLAFGQRAHTCTAKLWINPTRCWVPRGSTHLAAIRALVHDLHPVTEQEAGVVAPACRVLCLFQVHG